MTLQKYQFYFKMFRTLKTELCAKSGSIAMISFRNIANKIFLPIAFDPRSRLFPHYRFSGPSQMRLFFWFGAVIHKRLILYVWKLRIYFSLGRGFWSCVASCFQLFYVKDQCRMMYRIPVMICLPILFHCCFSINLLVLALYHECRSLIGYATHYLFCDKKCVV